MCKSRIVLCTLAVFLSAQPCSAITDVPDLSLSEAYLAFPGPGPLSLLVVPDGSGKPFTEARDEDGVMVDATVTLHLRDAQGVPFILFPHEDMWLATLEDGLVSCSWGMLADQDTDHNGMTHWANPALAGGYSQGPIRVFVIGSPLTSNNGLPLWFNSPDMNGDLVVNLLDVVILSGDYLNGYHFRSDLNGDGALNLLDVYEFAQHIGAQCQ
jgi:hypothetical protein